MNRSITGVAGLFLCTWLSAFAAAKAQSADFQGFQVDMSRLTLQQKAALTPSYREQIRIIEAAKLPTEMLEFFKTVPIIIDPAFSTSGTHALYRRNRDNRKGQV